jgi:hypothetical protein
MNFDDQNAEYLASGEGHPSGQREKLDAVRVALGGPSTWATPPPDVESAVVASIQSGAPDSDSLLWGGWFPRVAAFAAVALAAVVLMVLWPAGTTVDLIGTELIPQASGVATLDSTGSGWSIEVDLEGVPPAHPGTYSEGWVWSDDGKGVSIGTFHLRTANEPVNLWAGVDISQYPSIWISVQTEGAGNEVSDQIVMRGRLAELNE